MKSLEYQRELAEYEEKISYHNMRAQELEHEKARFVRTVLSETLKDREQNPPEQKVPEQGVEVIANAG